MRLKNKINLKVYFGSSLLIFALAMFFAGATQRELVIFGAISFSIVLNQLFLFLAVYLLTQNEKVDYKGVKISFFMLSKTFIIGTAFYWGIQLIGDRIIIPIILYIIQLAILGLSLVRK